MDTRIYLNVKTVPAFDTETLMPHTAYTVYRMIDKKLLFASGWTLKDSIAFYASKYACDISSIHLIRPFKAQLTSRHLSK